MRSIPIPPGFDPNAIFGNENDDGIISREATANNENRDGATKPNAILSWKEKERLLHRIYDEGEIPAEILSKHSSSGNTG